MYFKDVRSFHFCTKVHRLLHDLNTVLINKNIKEASPTFQMFYLIQKMVLHGNCLI